MTLEQFLLALRARWKVILAMIALTLVAAGVVTALAPRVYTATAAVVIDVKFADPIAGSVLSAWTQPSFIPTQLDIITSDRVAIAVVKALKLDTRPGIEQTWRERTGGRGNVDAWLADGLRGSLEAKPSKDSNVIMLNVKNTDPQMAADVANAFAQAYIDSSVDLRREPARQYERYFVAQAQAARDRLEKAQAALSTFQQTNKILLSDDRSDIETNRLTSLSSQLVEAEGQRTESRSREAQAKAAGGSISEVLQSPLVQNLKADLAREEAKLVEMSATMGPANPQLQRQEATVNSLRRRVQSESAQLATGVSTSNRVNVQRVAELTAAVDAQKARVLKLKQDRDAAAVLQRDVDAAKTAYDAISAKTMQSNLESQASTTNIAVLSPAVEPSRPSSPKVFLNLGIALILGVMLGVGAALVLEQTDRRVRSIDDLGRMLGLPVMGVVGRRAPRIGGARRALPWSRRDPLRLSSPDAA